MGAIRVKVCSKFSIFSSFKSVSTRSKLSEIVLSHRIDFSCSAYSENARTSKSHIDEGLLDIPIENGWDLIATSKAENFAQKEEFLHERYGERGKSMHIDESDAS